MTCKCPTRPRWRNRVTVQKPGGTADGSGHPDLSLDANWVDVGSFSANILTRGGRERWRFNQVEAEVDRIVELRSSKKTRAITPEYRLRVKQDSSTRKWEIKAAFDRDSAREIVEVHCVEVV